MSGLRRRLLSVAVGVVLAGAVVAGLSLTAGSSGPMRAPTFSLPSLSEANAKVGVPVVEGGRNLPVVLTFFASWCGPCRAELPMIATVAGQLSARGVRIAFVGVDGNDDDASGLAFARQSGVQFPMAEDHASSVAPRYDLPGYPATVFIDASGSVVHEVRGPVTASELRTWAARISSAA